MNTKKQTITIANFQLEEFKGKIKKFNNKLKKYDRSEAVEYTIIREYEKELQEDGYTFKVNLVDIEIDDVTVTLNAEHKVVAKIELALEDNAVVTIYDREHKIEEFQGIKTLSCDHCNSNRNRKKGFILKEVATGKLLQIGATCMKDYTQDLAIMDKMNFSYELLSEYEFDELGYITGMMGATDWLTIEEVIAYTNRVVKADGEFISVKDVEYSNVKSTKEKVEIERMTGERLTKEELDKAMDMIDVIKECTIETIMNNDFNIQLLDAIKNRYCKVKNIGKCVWIHQLYEKIVNYKEKEEIQTVNEYVGEIGSKLEMELKSVANIWIESYYGNQCMNKFVDREGRVFVWWTTKEVNTDDEYINMKFTVKEHKEYNEELQTIILRVKQVK